MKHEKEIRSEENSLTVRWFELSVLDTTGLFSRGIVCDISIDNPYTRILVCPCGKVSH